MVSRAIRAPPRATMQAVRKEAVMPLMNVEWAGHWTAR